MKSELLLLALAFLGALVFLAGIAALTRWHYCHEYQRRNPDPLPPRPTPTPPPPRPAPTFLDKGSLEAAALKYLKLGEEIAACSDAVLRANMIHTHSKLGIFLGDALGYGRWRDAKNAGGEE